MLYCLFIPSYFCKYAILCIHIVSLRSHHLCRKGICVVLMVMFVVALLYNSRQVTSTGFYWFPWVFPVLSNISQLSASDSC